YCRPAVGGGPGFGARAALRYCVHALRTPMGEVGGTRPGSSVGTSVRLKIGRSAVRPRPWPPPARSQPATSTSQAGHFHGHRHPGVTGRASVPAGLFGVTPRVLRVAVAVTDVAEHPHQ